MKTPFFCTLLGVLVACTPTQPANSAATPPAGAHGAAAEATSARYSLPETGQAHAQSPINIVSMRASGGSHAIQFHYHPSKGNVQNLGHTVKVTYDAGSSVELDGKSYDLVQFHFHTPAEHLIDAVTYPMELHLVHTEHGHPEHFLVVSVLFKEGKANPLLERLIPAVPSTASEGAAAESTATASAASQPELDASTLIAPGAGYYHYEGSLTTPPYTEAVTWLILDQVPEAAAEQIEAMNSIEGNNARHIQDQHARLVDHAH